jgi:hypothetical protein
MGGVITEENTAIFFTLFKAFTQYFGTMLQFPNVSILHTSQQIQNPD